MAHSHAHNINNRFVFGVLLNVILIIVEIFYGIKANSVALIADATHNAGDVVGLLMAWFGYWLAHKKAPQKFTYGFKNATVITAFINAILLFVAVGGISWESIGRLGQHETVASEIIVFVASISVVINGLTAYLFFEDRHSDFNIKVAFSHMILDVLVSLSVIVAGILIFWGAWAWIDPAISLIIAAVILIGSWKLFRESLDLILLSVPTSIDLATLKRNIKSFEGVVGYHDFHVWPLSTTETALSMHLVVKPKFFQPLFCNFVEKELQNNFKISHVTIQLETEDEQEKCTTNCL